jgi:small conductance mechanosensitive channel
MTQSWTEITHVENLIHRLLVPFLLKVIGAFALWTAATLVIRWAKRILGTALRSRNVDPTLILYANQTLAFSIRALAVVAILSLFGIETTSFSAVLAAAGVAIGVAWSGLLSNFAAGVFLIVFRPFKAGDVINGAGVSGVVREIGLFATLIDNADQQRIFVANHKLFSDNIVNSSSHPWRLASFRVHLGLLADTDRAIKEIMEALAGIPGVRPLPPVSGEIIEFTAHSLVLQFKAACTQADYATVLAAGHSRIHAVLKDRGHTLPPLPGTPFNP